MIEPHISGDLRARAVMHGAQMAWQQSPSGTVWRKRFHRVGAAESGQVTSLVRYEPDSRFPIHDHPEGEEILVLEGVFSDEHGDYPAGSYLLNPEGFRHAPFSREGCLLFVKLRQYPGRDRVHISLRTGAMRWAQSSDGVGRKTLFSDPRFPECVKLERWPAGLARPMTHPEGVELFVLQGEFEDEAGCYPRHTWLRLPAGVKHQARSAAGCELYVKRGGLTLLRDASGQAGGSRR